MKIDIRQKEGNKSGALLSPEFYIENYANFMDWRISRDLNYYPCVII
jgi:hypothetical protein